MLARRYFGPSGAQTHFREFAPRKDAGIPPLLCLPPSPHSSLYYANAMPHLAKTRRVIAIDYPGFGGSDSVDGAANIPAYAERLLPMVEEYGPVDVLGFHTGNLVAQALASICPRSVRKVVMVDVPYFDADTRQKYHGIIVKQPALPNSADEFESEFEKQVIKRKADLGHARAYELWAETLRATDPYAAFHAAFTYDCEAAFGGFEKEVNIIATKSGLLEPSRAAANALPHATLTERLDIDRAVFDLFAEDISAAILNVLNN